MLKVWYDTSAHTLVISFGKFAASVPTEEYFEVADGTVPIEELVKPEWYHINWAGGYPGGTPALVRNDQGVIDDYEADKTKVINSDQAVSAQNDLIANLEADTARVTQGLPASIVGDDLVSYQNQIQALQGDVDNPSADPAYFPPLPPGVNPPPHEGLTVAVKRVPGYLEVLGYRAVIYAMADDFVPTNLAMSIYSASECNGYLYTTGAFQWDAVEEEWFAICPPGQEPGDVDIHFGVLYGAAQLVCFTLPAGQQEMVVNAYS